MFNRKTRNVHFSILGDVSKELMHVTDWFPTIYEAAGGNVSDLGDIDSFSMLDLLTGKNLTSPRSEVLVNIDPMDDAVALKSGRFKYLRNPRDGYPEKYDYWFQAPGKYPDSNETITPGTKKALITIHYSSLFEQLRTPLTNQV